MFQFHAETAGDYYLIVDSDLYKDSGRLEITAYDAAYKRSGVFDDSSSVRLENGKKNTARMQLPKGTTYFDVRSTNNDGHGSYTIEVAGGSTCKVEAGTNADGKPRLTWKEVRGAAKYVIYRSGYSNGTYKKMFTTTNTSYTNTSAKTGYTYYYKVSALDKKGKVIAKSGMIKQKSITPKLAKLTVTSENSDAGKPKLTWKPEKNATKYVIYRSGYRNGTYKKMFTTTNTSYTNTSAKAGYTYYYKVSALSKNGKAIAKSDIVKQTCRSPKLNLIAGRSGTGKPKLVWNSIPGVARYEVHRGFYEEDYDLPYGKVYTTTNTSYTDTKSDDDETYTYCVVAVYKDNKAEKLWSNGVHMRYALHDLEVTKSNSSDGKPKVSWRHIENAKYYEIYRSGYKNGTYQKMYTTTKNSYTNTSAKRGYTYYYRVRAVVDDTFMESNSLAIKCR